MNAKAADSFHYCADAVRRLDEDRWLSAQYASRANRDRLLALYALHLEIERAPAAVSEAPLGEIRLQWWREALGEVLAEGPVRAHPVIEAAASAKVIDQKAHAAFEASIDARARLLYDEPFRDVDDLESWLRVSEGYLAGAALRALGGVPAQLDLPILDTATAFALARYGVALAPKFKDAIAARASDLFMNAESELRALSAKTLPAVLHFSLTRGYLEAQRPQSPIARRWRLFASMAAGRL